MEADLVAAGYKSSYNPVAKRMAKRIAASSERNRQLTVTIDELTARFTSTQERSRTVDVEREQTLADRLETRAAEMAHGMGADCDLPPDRMRTAIPFARLDPDHEAGAGSDADTGRKRNGGLQLAQGKSRHSLAQAITPHQAEKGGRVEGATINQ